MKRLRGAILVVAVGLAVPLVWATPAFAARGLTVTPSTGLIDRQIVRAPGQPDGRIKQRRTGAITGDNVYGDDGSGQTRIRAVPPATKWTFALQVENDGLSTDDIKITAPPSSSPFTVRYFFKYFDITSSVTGSGFTFTGQVPGQIQTFAAQFTVDPGAPVDSRADPLVTFTSKSAGSTDAVRVGVVVVSAGADSLVDGSVSGEAPFDRGACPVLHQQFITTVDVTHGPDGTLLVDTCVTLRRDTFVSNGTFVFTAPSGTLTGTANGTAPNNTGSTIFFDFTLTVTQGTQGFGHTSGTLSLVVQFTQTAANSGTVTGALTAALTH